MKVPVQADGCVRVQHPLAAQQAPGGVQGLGVQVFGPGVKTLGAAHPPAERMVHTPAAVQHEPTFGHGLGSQTDPGPLNRFGATHPAAVTLVHAPVVALQQAPSRAVQELFGRHVVPTPRNVLVPVQAPAFTLVHVPAVLQQAPVLGQGLTKVQAVPEPWKTLVPVQLAGSVTVHAPVVAQHAPSVVGAQPAGLAHAAPSVTVSRNGPGTTAVLNVLTRMR
jgi:hypothetical protein